MGAKRGKAGGQMRGPPGLKGFKGGGKTGGNKGGWGKDGGKGGKAAAKGKGKGYQGYCFDCGMQGHKRGEMACPMVSGSVPMDVGAVEQDQGGDVAAVEFGGGAIWELACCQVEVVDNAMELDEEEEDWQAVKRKRRKRKEG